MASLRTERSDEMDYILVGQPDKIGSVYRRSASISRISSSKVEKNVWPSCIVHPVVPSGKSGIKDMYWQKQLLGEF